MCDLICWMPPTTRLSTKFRNATVSGAEKPFRPRYRIEDGLPDDPPQQPQW